MNGSRFADVRARARGTRPTDPAQQAKEAAPAPGPTDTTDEDEEKDMSEIDKKTDADKPKADAATAAADIEKARADERSRWGSVLAHDNAKGRMKAAVALLSRSASTSDEIVAILGDMDEPGADAKAKADDAAADARLMLDGIRQQPNPDVTDDGGKKAAAKDVDWAAIRAEAHDRRKSA
jgi:hypothetical protein